MSDEIDEASMMLPYEYPYGDAIDQAMREIDAVASRIPDFGLPWVDKREMVKIRAILQRLLAGNP
ncbi:hypothetical protein RDV84_19265 [Lysobacter yananisis]|uniref:Uncharacterized protein n=1 Tax=Lysobacter yananisis TaxID=1003114 RepID=A0ABY9P6Q6_9GAMM|nr:hypothetical protein [Lysobacter yananisis]WMT02083.1 hypothetical protein RDV84_19265 [Lysobacter yananisis]